MEAVTTRRRILRWGLLALFVFAVCSAAMGSWAAVLWMFPLGIFLFWAWWPSDKRATNDRDCSVCGYQFPSLRRDANDPRRCPECGSVD
jgi:membrane protein implicated in regulation of membrane protease activity